MNIIQLIGSFTWLTNDERINLMFWAEYNACGDDYKDVIIDKARGMIKEG